MGIRPLAMRLLVYVLLFSFVISLVATGAQMIGEFERRQSDLQEIQKRAAGLVSGGMSNNIWLMNFSEVANSLDDMRAGEAIHYARVVTSTGEQFTTGSYPEGRVISQPFPLVFNRSAFRGPEDMGTLTLTSSVEQVYSDLRNEIGRAS